ncbi:hypothetical protein SBOR_9512 [Sclerotinia borealis F-4128]|uniref:Transmembrane protein n=1 Tax=Sclerotinia borealis (strain F-4128) TaxID=1432307 RepID=W9C2I2_SCLBF|nr:hypothetical protein SBOR_9512 [Sclerotinia borealis F-4128]
MNTTNTNMSVPQTANNGTGGCQQPYNPMGICIAPESYTIETVIVAGCVLAAIIVVGCLAGILARSSGSASASKAVDEEAAAEK